jgi:hypothetical protein
MMIDQFNHALVLLRGIVAGAIQTPEVALAKKRTRLGVLSPPNRRFV